ncbi:MAG TPA: hypothetical protein VF960_09065 [Chloroflexota bacterium]
MTNCRRVAVSWTSARRIRPTTAVFGPLGYVPPIEFEEAYHRRQEDPAVVAGLT